MAGVEVEVVPSEDTVETVVAVASRPLECVDKKCFPALFRGTGVAPGWQHRRRLARLGAWASARI